MQFVVEFLHGAGPPPDQTQGHFSIEMSEERRWLIEDFFVGHILPSLMFMTNQFSAIALQQVEIVGTFLDGKHQLETQMVIQEWQLQALKDYQPMGDICVVGTNMRSLASSERKSDYQLLVLNKFGMDRQLASGWNASSNGDREERAARLRQFKANYCDPRDNNNGLTAVCGGGAVPARRNRDIDYARFIDHAYTLDVDFNTVALNADETDVFALMRNLYMHQSYSRLSARHLQNQPGTPTTANQELYLKQRALMAKRNVAQNSFNAIVAMKSVGAMTAETLPYMTALLTELGIPDDEITIILKGNPSYYAQMEVMTKKVYQDPNFYINLYDKPANVARRKVALRAIDLIQSRDIYLSQTRTEMMMSILLELAVQEEQDRVQNDINQVVGQGHR